MNIQNFHVGDLIVVADKNLSRANLLFGRIIEIFSGSNNMIHIAKVKTHREFKYDRLQIYVYWK